MTHDFSLYHQEVTQKYLASAPALAPEKERYLREKMYQTRYRIHGVTKEIHNKLVKEKYSFSTFEPIVQARIWSYIFKNTDYLGVGHLAIDHFKSLQRKRNANLIQYWPHLKTWIHKIENWAHGDMLASLYSTMLEEDSKTVYPTLQLWSRSNSPWKKRMAMVSLLYYYNCRTTVLPYKKIIAIVEPHLEIDHYYLQKAVGWTLRELTQAYPKETEDFLDRNVFRISPTAFSAAIEKLLPKKKEKLKTKRKLQRKARKRAK